MDDPSPQPPSRTKATRLRQRKQTAPKSEPQSFSCIICDETTEYYAVGICDHPICSVCALRMRLVAQDKNCSVCKQRMDFMIVSALGHGVRSFQSFGIFADTMSPGIRIDHAASLNFVNCSKHCKELEGLRSVTCSRCSERFRHQRDLSKHLSAMHEMAMCDLCVSNLRLFICEQRLYSKLELKNHMSHSHPSCQFCKSNLFDSMQLYGHMRDRHFSCYLCPPSFQHRFYKSIGDLELHFKHSHLTCSTCFSQSPVGSRSYCVFRSNNEYRDHMWAEHNVNIAPNSTSHLQVSFKFSSKSGQSVASESGAEDNQQPTYLDLFVDALAPTHSTEDPSSRNNAGKKKKARGVPPIETPLETEGNLLRLVPDNMQIAGRVTGAGLFTRDRSDDVLEEYSREVQTIMNQRSGYASRLGGNASSVRTDSIFDFPALPGEASIATDAAPPGLHPLSMVSKMASKSGPKDGSIDSGPRALSRKDAFAEALGIKRDGDQRQDISASGASPLYPPSLLTWAVQNKTTLLKTEKRITTFLNDKNAASLQLPPMAKTVREGIHILAMYYGLNSHEFDSDPKRYISLVKTAGTAAPSAMLSAAAQRPWVSVATAMQRGSFTPGVFISLQETPKAPVFSNAVIQKVDGILSSLCTAEINGANNLNFGPASFSHAMKLLRPVKVNQFNACTILLEYSSVSIASRIYAVIAAKVSELGEAFLIIPAYINTFNPAPSLARPTDLKASADDGFKTVTSRSERPRASAWDDDIPSAYLAKGAEATVASSIESDYVFVSKQRGPPGKDQAIPASSDPTEEEEEWESIDVIDLIAPRTLSVATSTSAVLFPTTNGSRSSEHFVSSKETSEEIAHRKQEWINFLDTHNDRLMNDPGFKAYQPPQKRPQTLENSSRNSSTRDLNSTWQKKSQARNYHVPSDDSRSYPEPLCSDGRNTLGSASTGPPNIVKISVENNNKSRPAGGGGIQASFSMLQVEDDSSEDDDN